MARRRPATPRVVFDTNVIVSALVFEGGAFRSLRELWLGGAEASLQKGVHLGNRPVIQRGRGGSATSSGPSDAWDAAAAMAATAASTGKACAPSHSRTEASPPAQSGPDPDPSTDLMQKNSVGNAKIPAPRMLRA